MQAGRTCGRCTVCCTHMQVGELHKPEGETCYLVTKEGCGAYDDRPDSCRKYECFWLMGFGKEGHRPDRSNALLYVEDSPKLGRVVVVTETKPNGLRNPKAQGLLKELKRSKLNLYIRKKDGTLSLQGSPDYVKKAEAVVETMAEEKRSRVRLKVIGQ